MELTRDGYYFCRVCCGTFADTPGIHPMCHLCRAWWRGQELMTVELTA